MKIEDFTDFQGMYLRDKKLLKKIAFALKELREKRGLTQIDVYDETKISVARIEVGETNINISTLSALLSFYDTKLSEFFRVIDR